MKKIITTSWDDGFPADHKIAELLDKYNLQGTFYVPKKNAENEVMKESQILEVADEFEVGGHTMNHVRIDRESDELFEEEILGCYNWLSRLTGEAPKSFCFPGGVYNDAAVEYALNSGFEVVRGTELLNTCNDVSGELMPTTLQMYPHSQFTYVKHLLKRLSINSLMTYLQSGTGSDIFKIVDHYLNHVDENGGCFHLWGHSWEIEEYELWDDLEAVLQRIAGHQSFDYVPNSDLTDLTE